MPCVLPLRKMMSVISKPAHAKKKRMPSTLKDSMEDSTLKNVASFYRPWLVVVLGLALMYNLYVFNVMYKSPSQTKGKGDNSDIQVFRSTSTTTTCGLGCNIAEVSNMTNTNIADSFYNKTESVIDRIPNYDFIRNLSDGDNVPNNGSVEIRYKIHKLDFRYREDIKPGGYYKPRGCVPRSKVAIIVPYRDRETNLLVFLYNIHPFLIDQRLEYRIFVIEQSGHEKFNKGRLFNVGFDQAERFGSWECLVFHDVNLLPLHVDTSYTCPTVPTQMSTRVVRFKQTYPHESSFGGVTAMTRKHFRTVNGYSNLYWGSVGADLNNMCWRMQAARLPIKRYDRVLGRYAMLPHTTEKKKSKRYKRISTGIKQTSYKIDGLANCHYKIISIKLRSLYTHVVVDINPNKDSIE